jgi:putative pre-16S rRNA nuclease
MARLLGIDFGTKRVGLAVTDPLKIIATPIKTVSRDSIMEFLNNYVKTEEVEGIVIGWPKDLMNRDTHATAHVERFIRELNEKLPSIPVFKHDERFTSKMALSAMIAGGMKKKERRNKENIDKISACIILQSYLEQKEV